MARATTAPAEGPHLEETYNPQAHLKFLRAGYSLSSEQAKEVVRAIFAVMATGTLIIA